MTQGRVRHAGADATAVHKLAPFVIPDQQSADAPSAIALTGNPAPDDELLAVPALDLDPRARPFARLVAAVQPFGDHTFQADVTAALIQCCALPNAHWGRAPEVAVKVQRIEL